MATGHLNRTHSVNPEYDWSSFILDKNKDCQTFNKMKQSFLAFITETKRSMRVYRVSISFSKYFVDLLYISFVLLNKFLPAIVHAEAIDGHYVNISVPMKPLQWTRF